jgi:DNA-binding response OmpR family regulator
MVMGPTRKVMLVEDDLTMQAVLRTLLEIEGFAVTVAPLRHDIADLLGSIHVEQPDILLLDYHLGDTNGLDVLRRLRADQDSSRTRVIMTSGMDLQERCLAAGADGFILKPFMPDELIQKLRG